MKYISKTKMWHYNQIEKNFPKLWKKYNQIIISKMIQHFKTTLLQIKTEKNHMTTIKHEIEYHTLYWSISTNTNLTHNQEINKLKNTTLIIHNNQITTSKKPSPTLNPKTRKSTHPHPHKRSCNAIAIMHAHELCKNMHVCIICMTTKLACNTHHLDGSFIIRGCCALSEHALFVEVLFCVLLSVRFVVVVDAIGLDVFWFICWLWL